MKHLLALLIRVWQHYQNLCFFMSYQITDHLRWEGGLQHPGALKLWCCIPRENSEQLFVRAVEQQELHRRQLLEKLLNQTLSNHSEGVLEHIDSIETLVRVVITKEVTKPCTFLLCRRAKAQWLHGESCCVCGNEPCEPRDGPGRAGAPVRQWVTRRRGGDLLPALQHIPHRLSGDTALLHTQSTTHRRDFSGSGLPHPANLFSFKWKECHKLLYWA